MGRGQVVQGLVDEEKKFLLNALLDRKPAQVLENGGDVCVLWSRCE